MLPNRCSRSLCRYAAFSSISSFASPATSSPVLVTTSGLISAVTALDQPGKAAGQLAQLCLIDELTELEIERSAPGIRIQPRDRVGRFLRDLLDFHAALRRNHEDIRAR